MNRKTFLLAQFVQTENITCTVCVLLKGLHCACGCLRNQTSVSVFPQQELDCELQAKISFCFFFYSYTLQDIEKHLF